MLEINYRFEYNGNPEFVTLHLTERLTEQDFANEIVEAKDQDTRTLYVILKGSRGAAEISLRPYSVTIKRGTAFDRDEALGAALENLKTYFAVERGALLKPSACGPSTPLHTVEPPP